MFEKNTDQQIVGYLLKMPFQSTPVLVGDVNFRTV